MAQDYFFNRSQKLGLKLPFNSYRVETTFKMQLRFLQVSQLIIVGNKYIFYENAKKDIKYIIYRTYEKCFSM